MADASTQAQTILQAGLFDAAYYVRANGLAWLRLPDPLAHYCEVGEALGYRPNFLFDPVWYRATYAVAAPDALLFHYATEGEGLGHAPSVLFDPLWYRQQHETEAPLAHYLANREAGLVSPNPFFDTALFLEQNPDAAADGLDPFEDYVTRSVFEGRHASPRFDADYVWRRYLNGDRAKNAYLLFLQCHRLLGWTGIPDPEAATVAGEILKSTAPGPGFEERPPLTGGLRRVKALAFYLPQFHAIPENDRWWGPGFTEWRNVPRGVPRFKDDYQPRLPRDLGYYELDGTDVLKRQIALARRAGLHGFCFYYYNFNGHRLLEKPLDAYLADADITFPFCLMWANENWTRRWDGLDQEVLIGQDYRPEDASALVADLARHLGDPRYIRLNGRPLLFLYRGDVIPDTARTLQRWRVLFRREHGLDPLFVMGQTFGNTDPRPFGFDAAVEFPPHKFGSLVPRINGTVEVLEPGFNGDIRSYDDVVAASLGDFPAAYSLIKTVVPSWDNEARKPGRGLVLHGSTPAKFQAWVEAVAARVEQAPVFGERLLCVNAWNEWCEGAYLEPDLRYGHAYLNALARGLSAIPQGTRRKLLLVGHDAYHAGAQHLLLNIAAVLRFRFGVEVSVVLMGGGPLVQRYADIAPTYAVDPRTDFWPALVSHLHALRADGFVAAITNSTFSGHVVPALADLGFTVCSLVHELRTLISRNEGAERIRLILGRSNHVVFPSPVVQDEVAAFFGKPARASAILPQGLYKEIAPFEPDEDRRIRDELGIGPQTQIVLNAGFADLRKGVDLFVTLARFVALVSSQIVFVWVGDVEAAVDAWLLDAVRADPGSNMRFLPFTEEISPYLNAADLFLLTSREDPFPSVVLEALSAGVPVAALRGSGGFVDLLSDGRLGLLLPADNLAEAADGIVRHLAGRTARGEDLDATRRQHIAEHYDFGRYCFEIMRRAMPAPTVSVIVPNYNYAGYLEGRLASIFNQTHPVFEIIVLDDCSSDGSVAEVERVAEMFRRDLVLIESDARSGHVSTQWLKGVERARGELVWIAEADDLAEPGFLDGLVAFFERPDTAFAFADSSIVDHEGVIRGHDYKFYYDTVFPGALATATLFEGPDFLDTYLSVKNVILNASAVVWRREVLAHVLAESAGDLARLHVAGDWLLYAQACALGAVGYNADPLNIHRRHDDSVTQTTRKDSHIEEVAIVQDLIRRRGKGPADLAERQARYREEISLESGVRAGRTEDIRREAGRQPDPVGGSAPPRSRA